MADSGQLLRMLEPAVRPVSAPAGERASPTGEPIEHRSFESLLAEATSSDAQQADVDAASVDSPASSGPNLLGPLSQVGSIENASLRALIERGG